MRSLLPFPITTFQSTRPSRASTNTTRCITMTDTFQSTRPSRASTNISANLAKRANISIHKALTGLDLKILTAIINRYNFNPQGPHGPRLNFTLSRQLKVEFQSTRPSRASTITIYEFIKLFENFNPQGPHGPRPIISSALAAAASISIHKALTGLDRSLGILLPQPHNFNPQGPHGPRHRCQRFVWYHSDFNPQGPHGPRR